MTLFKSCLYLVETKQNDVVFCLNFREWIDQCPPKCGYRHEGGSVRMKEVEQRSYDIDCVHCTRKCCESDQSSFVCDKLEIKEPLCEECEHAEYVP
ncbi:MAG: hypothetical protein ACXADY_17790 [Candidatus Hodarchaeales archaeon]|jgi:hypothetical protein